MFCMKCGHPIAENAHFCEACGYPVSGNEPKKATADETGIPVIAACYLKDGLIKKHPAVLWMDRERCVFLRIDEALLERILQEAPPPPKFALRETAVALAFHPYAKSMRGIPLSTLLERYPDSLVLDTAGIRSFSCEECYDSERHKDMEYILFKVTTDTQKYHGVFEPDLLLCLLEPALRVCLQNRYHCHHTVY
ncbi:MAG TPA: zinc ribbon domain-containing protein [Oscillospiraceae bacterium]|nr:zinc ribbon domain-containing protein [Oscillospiraceae bacterium]